MANENTSSTLDTRRVFFGENEGAALSFVDAHWQRVVCVGYVTESIKEAEPAGWVVSYLKKDNEVPLHPLSDSFDTPQASPRSRRSNVKSSS